MIRSLRRRFLILYTFWTEMNFRLFHRTVSKYLWPCFLCLITLSPFTGIMSTVIFEGFGVKTPTPYFFQSTADKHDTQRNILSLGLISLPFRNMTCHSYVRVTRLSSVTEVEGSGKCYVCRKFCSRRGFMEMNVLNFFTLVKFFLKEDCGK